MVEIDLEGIGEIMTQAKILANNSCKWRWLEAVAQRG
jgi:hypothetical protein